MASLPSVEELREQAARLGVVPSAVDLERVRAHLAELLPALEALDELLQVDVPPAAVFRPEEEP
jgi:hypothetical protein